MLMQRKNICKYTDSSEPNYQLVLGELNKLVAQTWTQKRTWLNIVPQGQSAIQ